MEPVSSSIIVAHGGEWNNNVYHGGRKEYIPIPPCGLMFEDLLRKIEVRLKKDKNMYIFDIDALIKSNAGETMRMKITDDFEWSYLIGLFEFPTIHVNVSRRTKVFSPRNNLLSYRNLQKEQSDDDDPDFVVDRDFINDNSYDDESDGSNISAAVDRCTVPPLDNSTETTKENNGQWLILGAAYQASISCDDFVIPSESITGELVIGSFFSSKEKMTTALGVYHLKNRLEFATERSNTDRYHVVCKFAERCEFIMRARSFGIAWRIYEWSAHTCEIDLRYQSHPKVSSKVLAEHVGPNLLEEGYVLRPRDIQGQVLRDFGVNLNYRTALAGRNRALNLNYGDADKSFQLLPKYLYLLENLNPGSIVELQTCHDGSFQYCYFSLAACLRSFRACRPVIVIDATHLKGKYKGVMFVASTKDGNEQIVPLAFGVGDKENDSSWTWFLHQVRRTFGCPDNLLIVSDQHLSIKNAVDSVFPCIPQGLCSFHIQGNLKKWGKGVIDIFQAAANAYKTEEFEEHMQNLELTSPRAHAKLMGIDPMKWAICKCPVRRYFFGTSNAVESMNSRLKWARKLPICSLLEYARNLLQEWFYLRRTKAGARTHELSEYATKRLGNAIELGRSMKVEPITDTKIIV